MTFLDILWQMAYDIFSTNMDMMGIKRSISDSRINIRGFGTFYLWFFFIHCKNMIFIFFLCIFLILILINCLGSRHLCLAIGILHKPRIPSLRPEKSLKTHEISFLLFFRYTHSSVQLNIQKFKIFEILWHPSVNTFEK